MSLFALFGASSTAHAGGRGWLEDEARWYWNIYGGIMLEEKIEDTITPWEWTYADQNLIGGSLSYDRTIINSRWSVGFELQATAHFGDDQEYLEFGIPVTARYRPENPWFKSIESFAFGFGGSYTTDVPDVEVETRGESQEGLFYLMYEAEFNLSAPTDSWFFRIHHRSDAWGTLEEEGGSNAVVLGFRRQF